MSNSTINPVKLPKARIKEIVVQSFENEVLVYDLSSNKAHHLNKTISTVWEHCDGKTTTKEIAEILSKELKTKIEEDFVWIALDELNKVNLLETEIHKSDFTKLSRRKVLLRYALPAVSIPMVMSLIAPTAVHSQSCTAQLGQPCSLGGVPCCVGSLICGGSHTGPTCRNPG